MLGCLDGCCIERTQFECAERAVPDECCRIIDGRGDQVGGKRAGIQNHAVAWHSVNAIGLVWCVGSEMPANNRIDRQDDGAFGLFSLGHDFARSVSEVMFAKRFADIAALCCEESVGHAATNHQCINLLDKV